MDARGRFPFESRIANGLANLLKESGSHTDALSLYDKNVQQFPFDLFSKLGRADLLKRLGNYEAALDAYDQVLSVWPQFARARNAKASLLAIAGRLAEAEGLLPDVPPQTEDDWIASTFAG